MCVTNAGYSLFGTSKSMIFMSPPHRDFETQTWNKVVDVDIVDVVDNTSILSYVHAS